MDFTVRNVDQLEPILRSFRTSRGLTQVELAGRMGVTQQAVSLLEAAPHRASFERLLAVCGALDIEIVLRDKRARQVTTTDEW